MVQLQFTGLQSRGGSERYRRVGQTFHCCSEILFSPVDADYRILVTGHPSHLVCRLRKFFVVCDSYWYLLTRTTQMACSNFVFSPPPALCEVPHAPASLHYFIFPPSPSLLPSILQSTFSQASLISLYTIQSQVLPKRPFTYNITITRKNVTL